MVIQRRRPDADGDVGSRRPGAARGGDRSRRGGVRRAGFSGGSLNVIARRAGVAKGSLFQYFADKRDLYGFIADVASQRVRVYMEERIHQLDPSRPFFDFLTDWLDVWVAYFADHPHERALHAAATLEVDTDARVSVRSVIHRHYLEVLRPLVRDAQVRGDFREDADIDAMLSLLMLIFPHLALAPYMRGLDPVLGLDDPTPEQPALAVRRLVAVLAAAFSETTSSETRSPAEQFSRTRSEEVT